MTELWKVRHTLKETADIVLKWFPDIARSEAEEQLTNLWRQGTLPLYGSTGENVLPDEKRESKLDFENSVVRPPVLTLVIERGEKSTSCEVGGDGQEVSVKPSELDTLLRELKSVQGPRRSGSRRVGRPSQCNRIKEAFYKLKDSGKLKKSMTKKVIHNLVLAEMFGPGEIPPGHTYHSFLRHVGKDVDAWLSAKHVSARPAD